MQFEPQFPKDSVAMTKLKSTVILKVRLVDFPKINPAIKRESAEAARKRNKDTDNFLVTVAELVKHL
jgi:hypothetical protein